MKRFFTLLLAASCLNAFGQVPDYVPTDGLLAWFDVNGSFMDELSNIEAMSIDISFVQDRESTPDEAMEFNGSTSWISLGDIDPISEGQAGELSFSFWCSPYSWNDQQLSFLFGDEIYQNDGVLLQLDESFSSLTAFPGPGSSYVACECLPEFNNWTHVVYVQNAESIQVYLDGSGFMLSNSLNVETEDPWRIGAFVGGAYFDRVFHGAMDEVGFWTRALTEDEVYDLFIEQSQVQGCTDSSACNFDLEAAVDDGSCHFDCTFCLEGTIWNEELGGCVVANPSDSNFDGCVQLNDLLDLLAAYGDCGAEESSWQCGDPLEYQGYDYETVQIGEQCWFAENLTSYSFANGDPIPNGDEIYQSWPTLTTPGFGFPEFDTSFKPLYNFFVVDDTRGICPQGWVVPEISQFPDLTNWPDVSLPGYLNADPTNNLFLGQNEVEFFWSRTQPSDGLGFAASVGWDSATEFGFNHHDLNFGFSIRCIKD